MNRRDVERTRKKIKNHTLIEDMRMILYLTKCGFTKNEIDKINKEMKRWNG